MHNSQAAFSLLGKPDALKLKWHQNLRLLNSPQISGQFVEWGLTKLAPHDACTQVVQSVGHALPGQRVMALMTMELASASSG